MKARAVLKYSSPRYFSILAALGLRRWNFSHLSNSLTFLLILRQGPNDLSKAWHNGSTTRRFKCQLVLQQLLPAFSKRFYEKSCFFISVIIFDQMKQTPPEKVACAIDCLQSKVTRNSLHEETHLLPFLIRLINLLARKYV